MQRAGAVPDEGDLGRACGPSPRLRVPFDHLERGMQVKRLAIVICDGTPLGVMSFALGVFDLAKHYGALPAIDLRVVAGEPGAVLSGGGLACPLPYDLGVVRDADLVVIADWRDPHEFPPQPLLEALRAAHAAGGRLAAMCSGAFILAAAGLLDGRPATTHWAHAGLLAGKYPAIDVRRGLRDVLVLAAHRAQHLPWRAARADADHLGWPGYVVRPVVAGRPDPGPR